MTHPQPNSAVELLRRMTPLFQALGDPVRQSLIVRLAGQERLNVSQLAAESPMSRPTISHHLKILRQAGLVTSDKVGTEQYYHLELEDLVGSLKRLIQAVEEECRYTAE